MQTSVPGTNDTHEDDGQEGECGRPDTGVYREHGEALKNVCRACGRKCVIRCIPGHRAVRAYLLKAVAVRSRKSKNVMKMAIKISSPAETESCRVSRVCVKIMRSPIQNMIHIPTMGVLPLSTVMSTACTLEALSNWGPGKRISKRTHLHYTMLLRNKLRS